MLYRLLQWQSVVIVVYENEFEKKRTKRQTRQKEIGVGQLLFAASLYCVTVKENYIVMRKYCVFNVCLCLGTIIRTIKRNV